MFRMFMFLAFGAALLSAFALYAVSYHTRQLSDANQSAEKRIEALNRDIAVLRAERSFLMRPERIEPLARKLGMGPARGEQYLARRDLNSKMQRPR